MRKIESLAHVVWRKTPMAVFMVLAFVLVMWSELPTITGKILPVTTKAVMVDSRMTSDGLLLKFAFKKKLNCTFKSQAFYWKDDDGSQHRIPFRNANPAEDSPGQDTSRPVGQHIVTVVVETKLPAGRIRAHAMHSCWPLWDTKTVLWP